MKLNTEIQTLIHVAKCCCFFHATYSHMINSLIRLCKCSCFSMEARSSTGKKALFLNSCCHLTCLSFDCSHSRVFLCNKLQQYKTIRNSHTNSLKASGSELVLFWRRFSLLMTSQLVWLHQSPESAEKINVFITFRAVSVFGVSRIENPTENPKAHLN